MPITPLSEPEAIDRHLRLVHYGQLGLDYNRTTPKIVWHYTGIAGLDGILKSSALWASDYRFMNDRSELSFGLDILEMIIAHRESCPESLNRALRDEILTQVALMKVRHSLHVLTVSFCTKGNVLSQWRAYARHDGIAIGFRKEHLLARAAAQNFVTGPVHYYFSSLNKELSEAEQYRPWLNARAALLTSVLEQHEQAVERTEQASGSGEWAFSYCSRSQRPSLIAHWAAETAAFIKHPAFEEEREWRCVHVVDETTLFGESTVSHRTSGSKVIPFLNFDLKQEGSKDRGITALVLGPNADPGAIMHSASFLSRAYGLTDLSIACPFNPLRV